MNAKSIAMASALFCVAAPLAATPPLALYPERDGAQTARFYRGSAVVTLQTPTGTAEIRPMPVDKDHVALTVAIFNQSRQPGNFGIENITARVNGVPVAIPSEAQLAQDAERKARTAKIGTALFAGALAGVASTAHYGGTYYRHVGGPRGGFTQAVHYENDTPGIVGATVAVASGGVVIHDINRKLDNTLDQLGSRILQTTTIDPGNSFGGLIVIPVGRQQNYPAEIRLQISFNGAVYPFAFRLTPSGTAAPPPLPAGTQDTAVLSGTQRPGAADTVGG